MDGLPRVSGSNLWTLSPGGIYFVPAEAPRSLRYFDFAIRQIRPIFEVDNDFGSGLVSLSRWPLDPLFTSSARKQRHHARRSLSVTVPHSPRGTWIPCFHSHRLTVRRPYIGPHQYAVHRALTLLRIFRPARIRAITSIEGCGDMIPIHWQLNGYLVDPLRAVRRGGKPHQGSKASS